jgi:alanyl-tRNA synthetase
MRYEVSDVVKIAGRYAHVVPKSNDLLDKLNLAYERGHALRLKVDAARRHGIARAHTATHLLHAALKAVVGFHVNQAGSKVEFDRLTFDFTHFQPLTAEEIAQVEEKVNTEVLRNYPVHVEMMDFDEAVGEGAMALFGEKYGDRVRVVSVGGQGRTRVSSELCGGTHLPCIAEIGVMKIVREESLASGVRRIEALTGQRAQEHLFGTVLDLHAIAERMHSPVDSAVSAVEKLTQEIREREKKIRRLEDRLVAANASRVIELLDTPDGKTVSREGDRLAACLVVDGFSQEALRRLAESVAQSRDGVASCVIDKEGPKLRIVVALNPSLIEAGLKAGSMVKDVCKVLKGGGGGKPDLAEGGGSDPSLIQAAFDRFRSLLR